VSAEVVTSEPSPAARRLLRRPRLVFPSAYSNFDRAMVVVFGLLCGVFQAVGRLPRPIDAWTYWTANLSHLYPVQWGGDQLYIYPPPLAQLTTLLQPIGWSAFIVLWTTLLWAALAYMLGRWTWLFVGVGLAVVPLGYGAPAELSDVLGHALNGNVQLFIAAGLVIALRESGRAAAWRAEAWRAAGWLPAVLTKVVSGIGLGWYVFRFDWRSLVRVLAITAAVCAVSFAFAPNQWFEWVSWILSHSDSAAPVALEPIPFAVRLPACLALLLWGARTNRAWVVPIVVGFGTPALYLGTYPSMWIAAIPLFLDRRAAGRVAGRVAGRAAGRVAGRVAASEASAADGATP
jgi:hypothetical protein